MVYCYDPWIPVHTIKQVCTLLDVKLIITTNVSDSVIHTVIQQTANVKPKRIHFFSKQLLLEIGCLCRGMH